MFINYSIVEIKKKSIKSSVFFSLFINLFYTEFWIKTIQKWIRSLCTLNINNVNISNNV